MEEKRLFRYPNGMMIPPTLWLWRARDVILIGIGTVISALVLAITQFHILLPAAITFCYGFLSIYDDQNRMTIVDYILLCFRYITGQKDYYWR